MNFKVGDKVKYTSSYGFNPCAPIGGKATPIVDVCGVYKDRYNREMLIIFIEGKEHHVNGSEFELLERTTEQLPDVAREVIIKGKKILISKEEYYINFNNGG